MTISPTDTGRLLNRVRMRQVALLLALQARGTLSAAAAETGMTQPAATKMLHELESALQSRLFDRVSRRLRINEAGLTALGHFEAIRGTLRTLARDLAALNDQGGSLTIGSIMAPSPTLLSRAIVATKAAMKSLTVHVTIDTSDRLIDRLARGEMDLVIGRLSAGHSRQDYRVQRLAGEALAVVAGTGHRLAGRNRIPLRDLAADPWVVQPYGSPTRELIERAFELSDTDFPCGLVETASIFTTANLVVDSDHVAVLPLTVARLFQQHGMLIVLPVRLGAELAPYATIVRRDRPPSAATRRFLTEIHRLAATSAACAQGDASRKVSRRRRSSLPVNP